jgi:amidase/aspartyl-tRNA(Asn)/glutamyl-tRNA(Gln) amidotransferase subunit A
MSDDRCFLPTAELADRIRRRDLSPVDAVDAYLDRIEARNDYTTA